MAEWKAYHRENKRLLTVHDFALYAILRGRDWRECFAPATNKRKLANGVKPYGTIQKTMRSLSHDGTALVRDGYGHTKRVDVFLTLPVLRHPTLPQLTTKPFYGCFSPEQIAGLAAIIKTFDASDEALRAYYEGGA